MQLPMAAAAKSRRMISVVSVGRENIGRIVSQAAGRKAGGFTQVPHVVVVERLRRRLVR
jgi:hypothetical protein